MFRYWKPLSAKEAYIGSFIVYHASKPLNKLKMAKKKKMFQVAGNFLLHRNMFW